VKINLKSIMLIAIVISIMCSAAAAYELVDEVSSLHDFTKSSGIVIQDSEAKLLKFGDLSDQNTLLLTHFEDLSSIYNPAIGFQGSAINAYFAPGYIGNSLFLNASSEVLFPSANNFNYESGAINFWLSMPSWKNITSDKYVIYLGTFFEIKLGTDNRMHFYGCDYMEHATTKDLSGFEDNSWHEFTFTWDKETGYLMAYVDGELQTDGDGSSGKGSSTHNFPFQKCSGDKRLYLGNLPWGGNPLNGYLDELRITKLSYFSDPKLFQGITTPRILESRSFDTGLENPKWGNISFDAYIPQYTDIFLQVSVSDDNNRWSGWYPYGIYTLNVDDADVNGYTTIYPIMKNYNFTGTNYIITGNIDGSPGSLRLSQVKELQENGWEIGSHSRTHAYVSQSTFEKMAGEVKDSYEYLVQNNLDKSKYLSFAYPGGQWNIAVMKEMLKYYKTGRAVLPESVASYSGGYAMPLTTLDGNVNIIKNYIDKAKAQDKWVVSIIHDVCDSGCDVKTSDFISLMNYLKQTGINVTTMEGAMSLMHHNPEGSQILHANKRYIKYRALLWSYDGINTPVLKSVKIDFFNSSEPTNQTIPECTENIQCGDESYSLAYCKNGNVFINHSLPVCQSNKCGSNSVESLNQTCQYGCSNGACLPNLEVKCNNDQECGFSGFVGNFCYRTFIFSSVQNSICLYPGTAESVCNAQVTQNITENCNDGNSLTIDSCQTINNEPNCVHQPISCLTNADCSDNNAATSDKCLNPGTNVSKCQNTIIQQDTLTFWAPTPGNGASVSGKIIVNVSSTNPDGRSLFLDLDKTLAGYWNMDLRNPTGLLDMSSFNNTAMFGTRMASSDKPGRLGKGYYSNCAPTQNKDNSCSLIVAGSNIQNIGMASFTVEFWLKPGNSQKFGNYSGIMQKTSPAGYGWSIGYNAQGNAIKVDTKNMFSCTTALLSSAKVNPNEWTHVAIVFNVGKTNNVSYYFNGRLDKTSNTCKYLNTNSVINIKNYYGSKSYPFNGTLDEIRIWKRALTSQEIKSSYNSNTNPYINAFSLASGKHNIQAYETDSNGNVYSTEKRSFGAW